MPQTQLAGEPGREKKGRVLPEVRDVQTGRLEGPGQRAKGGGSPAGTLYRRA